VILRFHPKAELETLQAADWYDAQQIGLGDRFIDALDNKLESLQRNPKQGGKRWHSYRETLIETFPYLIVFLWIEEENELFISAVFHTSRNPRGKYRMRRA
jgi:plasmid stabilization system protein ParE